MERPRTQAGGSSVRTLVFEPSECCASCLTIFRVTRSLIGYLVRRRSASQLVLSIFITRVHSMHLQLGRVVVTLNPEKRSAIAAERRITGGEYESYPLRIPQTHPLRSPLSEGTTNSSRVAVRSASRLASAPITNGQPA